MAKIVTFDMHGAHLTPKALARIAQLIEQHGSVKVVNATKGPDDLMIRFGAAVQRTAQKNWRNRTLTDAEWEVIRQAAANKWKAT